MSWSTQCHFERVQKLIGSNTEPSHSHDAQALFALNGNPQVMRYTGEPLLPSLDAAKLAIENHTDFDNPGYGRWACVLKESQQIIGFCGLKYLSDLDEVDIGYRFLPEFWGKGYATEACIASLQFGFHTLRLHRIIGLVLPQNAASIRVLEKVGLQFECEFDYDGYSVLRYAASKDVS